MAHVRIEPAKAYHFGTQWLDILEEHIFVRALTEHFDLAINLKQLHLFMNLRNAVVGKVIGRTLEQGCALGFQGLGAHKIQGRALRRDFGAHHSR